MCIILHTFLAVFLTLYTVLWTASQPANATHLRKRHIVPVVTSFNGRPNDDDYYQTRRRRLDPLCFQRGCFRKYQRCAVSYNSETRECHELKHNSQVIYWARSRLIRRSRNSSDWKTYVSHTVLNTSTPLGLWTLDDVVKGKNLGSGGIYLDAHIKGLLWFYENTGIVEASKLMYPKGSSRVKVTVRLKSQRDTRKISNGFTYAAWIKLDALNFSRIFPDTKRMVIIDSLDHDEYYYSLRYQLSTHQLVMYASYDIVIDDKPVRERRMHHSGPLNGTLGIWRHVAATVDIVGMIKFYVNGRFLNYGYNPIRPKLGRLPSGFQIFGNGNPDSKFLGSMACVALYDRVIEEAEVTKLKQSCP